MSFSAKSLYFIYHLLFLLSSLFLSFFPSFSSCGVVLLDLYNTIVKVGSYLQGWWRANTMCSETTSPRLSFSYNLPGDGSVPIEQDITLLDSNLDFEFSNISIEHECSCADELFSNGIILPNMKEATLITASLPPLAPTENSKKQMMRMMENNSSTCSDQLEQRVSESKSSFWGFKRSSSLNFESRIRPSLCPLPLLSRSNSTGSLPNYSKSKKCKDHSQKQTSQKHHSTSTRKSSSSSSSSSLNQCQTNVKPQMCKNQAGVYGNYHYIGPVLNVPPKLFGFGSLLRCGMDKKSTKK